MRGTSTRQRTKLTIKARAARPSFALARWRANPWLILWRLVVLVIEILEFTRSDLNSRKSNNSYRCTHRESADSIMVDSLYILFFYDSTLGIFAGPLSRRTYFTIFYIVNCLNGSPWHVLTENASWKTVWLDGVTFVTFARSTDGKVRTKACSRIRT